MAYKPLGTYQDRDLNAQDLAKVNEYKAQYEAAKARNDPDGMREAHAGAEAIRKGWGYSGGSDGSDLIPTGASGGGGGGGSNRNSSGTVSAAQNALAGAARAKIIAQGSLSGGSNGISWTATPDPAFTGAVNEGRKVIWANSGSGGGAVQNAMAGAGLAQNLTQGGAQGGNYISDPNQWKALQDAIQRGQMWHTASPDIQKSLADQNLASITANFPGATRDESGTWWWNGNKLFDAQYNGPNTTNVLPPSWMTPTSGYAQDGTAYNITSARGLEFVNGAKPGETMVGGDGSRWTKNQDGSVTIVQGNKTFTVAGQVSGVYPQAFEMPAFEQTAVGQKAMSMMDQYEDRLKNFKPFAYDPLTDPLYQQYADSYTRSGQRAMTDVLGQLSARTGGLASSYAGSMAQQTYDQYMADLAGKLPELYQTAYNMWADDYNRAVGDYNRAFDRLKFGYDQYADDRDFQYRGYRDTVGDQQWNLTNTQNQQQQAREDYRSERAWQKGLDDAAYQRNLDERNFALQEQERQDSLKSELYDRVARGYRPTQEDAARYGLTQQELASLIEQYNNYWGAKSSKWWNVY